MTTTTPLAPDTRLEHVRPLRLALGSLVLTQVAHIGATLANDGQPEAHHASFGPPLHVLATIATIALIVIVGRRPPRAALLTAAMGGGVVVAALTYHVLPVDVDYNNPFWDGATGLQWATVVAGIIAGAWCVVVGLRVHRGQQ